MDEGSGEEDLFASLVARQADKEMRELRDAPVSDAGNSLLRALVNEIKQRGQDMTPLDLVKYQALGIPAEAVLFAGFVQGIAMPELDLAEANAESVGGLGVCLTVDSQLFAFWDKADGTTYLPNDHTVKDLVMVGARFLVIVSKCIQELMSWDGVTIDKSVEPPVVEVEGEWYGKPATTTMGQFVRYIFANRKLVFGDEKKMENVRFVIEMRKSTGMQ